LQAILDHFASAFECILYTQPGSEHTLQYCDNILAIFPHSSTFSDAPNRYKTDYSQICSNLGFRVKEVKNKYGHCIRFLSIEIDTETMEARWPHDNHEKVTALIISTLVQHSVTQRSLEMTVGLASVAYKVVPGSHPFLCGLNDTLTVTSRTHHIRVSSEIKKDLSWWRHFSHNRIESDSYTIHGKFYGYVQTHLDRTGVSGVTKHLTMFLLTCICTQCVQP
jgi:hypothetical protein